MQRVVLALGVAASAAMALGCGGSRQTAYLQDQQAQKQELASAGSAEQPDLKAQAEEAWAGRSDQAKLDQAIGLYKQILARDPADRETLIRLSRAYYFLGNGHLVETEAQIEAFDQGARYGEQAMALNPAFKQAIAAGASEEEALKHLTGEDVGGLYWAYSNLGKWSVAKGFTTVLKYKSKLKAFVDRVVALDNNFFYGAGDRGLGAFYAKAPSFAGGDLGKAKEHFDRSLQLAPDYLGTKVLVAEYYAVKTQNKELFKQTLEEVIAADPNSLPDIVPEQEAEQRRAKRLLEQMDDQFE